MLIGAGIAISCLCLGYLMGSSARRAIDHVRRSNIKIEPICGCKHHCSMHNDNGKCMEMVLRGSRWDQCACMKYIGPTPLTEIIGTM